MSSPQIEAQAMLEEASARGEALTAEAMIEASRKKRDWPYLHGYLWDIPESELAMEARLGRAHRLMISISVTTTEGTRTRLFVHTPGTRGYQPVEKVAADKDMAVSMLRKFAAEIGFARARLKAFQSVISEELRDDIDADLERAQNKTEAAVKKREERAARAAQRGTAA